jgi:hypothetical protein
MDHQTPEATPSLQTPDEREQRIAKVKEERALDRRIKRATAQELKRQPEVVRRIVAEQSFWAAPAKALRSDLLGFDDELPATAEARRAAADALDALVRALAIEIRSHWIE